MEHSEGKAMPLTKPEPTVHQVLSYSYLVYFLSFILAVILDKVFKLPLLPHNHAKWGIPILIIGTLIIAWAQSISGAGRHARAHTPETIDKDHFSRGPYVFTRSPTHLGIALMIIGFGFFINSLTVIIVTVIAYVLTKITSIKKEEKILEERFGQPYRDYKKKVRF